MSHKLANSILLGEVKNFHFVLKLWMAINDEAVDYLRWNDEKTAIILELGSLGKTYMSEMFGVLTVDKFTWLLKFNGFEQCSLEAPEHVVYRHSAFVMDNEKLFREWLLEGSRKNASCWLQPGSLANEFRPRENSDYFVKAKAKITAEMHLLDAHIRREYSLNKDQGALSMTVPRKYCDRIAIQQPEQSKTACITGYYGTASESEVSDFYGTMLPLTKDPDMADAGYVKVEDEDAFIDENLNTATNPSASLQLETYEILVFEDSTVPMDAHVIDEETL